MVHAVDTTFRRGSLSNGIRVLIAPIKHVDSAVCAIGFAAGQRCDTAETKGAAHFLEHVMFTGTERRPTMSGIAEEFESIGAQFNASTGRELTHYWVRSTADLLPQGIDILADMLRNTRFDPDEIEREKKVIVEEMLQTKQAPREYVDEILEHLLYGEHPLGWFLDGDEDTVRAMTPAALRSFWARWYVPDRTVVAIAGKVDDGVLGVLEEALGGARAAAGGLAEPAREGSSARVELESKDAAQAELCLGVRSYPRDHPDRYVLEIVRTVLGGGMSSRLYRELVAERGLTYGATAFLKTYADAGALMAHSGVTVDRAEEAVAAMVEIFCGLAEGVVQDELSKARNYAKGRFVFALETPLDVALFGVWREALEGRAAEPAEVTAGLDAVTAEDVQRVATDLLDGGLYLAVIGPFDSAEPFEELV